MTEGARRVLKSYLRSATGDLFTTWKELELAINYLVLLLALGDGGLLVLLVLGDQIVLVGLGLGELHLVYTLTSVPMQESLSMAVNWPPTRLKSSWMELELPTKVDDILRPRGGMEQRAVWTLLGIHSTK